MDLQAEAARLGNGDRERLIWMGERLDCRSAELGGETLGMRLARTLLRVRDRKGEIVPLEANAAQWMYESRRGQRNIVLKARQLGISTWVAGRFFLKTITRPGTLTVQVAHNREAAEQIFRIVHRFYEQLPDGLRSGVLRASRSNAGQILFPELDSEYRVESAADVNAGRGMTIQNLHCSEVARWGGDVAETLASLQAALVPGKLAQVFIYEGLNRTEVESAEAGEIVAISGLPEVNIGETVASRDNPQALPVTNIDEPTLRMTFGVNTSPFTGREGQYSTSRNLRARLLMRAMFTGRSMSRMEPTTRRRCGRTSTPTKPGATSATPKRST